ncbi:hypothetical protein K8T06_08945 [bacterium]|nr:hypothetical protein [bacterium]
MMKLRIVVVALLVLTFCCGSSFAGGAENAKQTLETWWKCAKEAKWSQMANIAQLTWLEKKSKTEAAEQISYNY